MMWKICKTVTVGNGLKEPALTYVERVEDEELFSSKEECEKRAAELNGDDSDEPYFCEIGVGYP